ncbi:hypothetical protein [Pseudoalteromonas marina]|uniref:Uncharacterized protein n=1 Tax=Pseudoalteromonas marina TaxID=267375 RepID=A0ABT9FCA4_9GAMM|nr:hypothetical protein [Pseudoalteromonas marina]MDP2564412.1 hypothetical protein [Pseudoalteromonas marina]
MNTNQITSIGWLNNTDKSITLTICKRGQQQTTFTSISNNLYWVSYNHTLYKQR